MGWKGARTLTSIRVAWPLAETYSNMINTRGPVTVVIRSRIRTPGGVTANIFITPRAISFTPPRAFRPSSETRVYPVLSVLSLVRPNYEVLRVNSSVFDMAKCKGGITDFAVSRRQTKISTPSNPRRGSLVLVRRANYFWSLFRSQFHCCAT
jgi:hypothetical protein